MENASDPSDRKISTDPASTHISSREMYDIAHLNAAQIVETALMALGNERDIAELRQLAPQPKLV